MIAAIRGTIARLAADEVVVDCNGVGYQLFCHVRTAASLRVGENVALQVHTAVSDDAIRLYGFRTLEELQLFRLLIGVERIGPKAALSILGRAELPVLVRAIRSDDAAMLSTVPGVGRKTGERICLELRGKLDELALTGTSIGPSEPQLEERRAVEHAVAALTGLGFREAEVRVAVASLPDIPDDVNELIATALRRLDRASSTA